MTAQIFSHPFLSIQGLNGASPTVTVPDDRVYIVKQLTFYSSPSLAPVRGYFRDLASGATLFSCAASTGEPEWFGFYGALVFVPGATFRWETTSLLTDAADVYAGGYVLTAP